MPILVGVILHEDPQYRPNLDYTVTVNDRGIVSIGHRNRSRVLDVSPEIAAQLGDLLHAAARKAPIVKAAADEAAQMLQTLKEASAARMAAIAAGETDMTVHMTVDLESQN